MVSSQKEASVIIKELLEDNWDNTNTAINSDPEITTGWWTESRSENMVTVSGQSENAIDGDRTGYFGYQSGNGPAKLMNGLLQVDCWSDAEQFETSTTNAKDVVYDFSEEVKRIITNKTFTVDNLRFASWLGRVEQPALNESPVLERQSCDIRYGYYIFP